MDGSDDYFGDDDFVLDETTLAVLDLEEQKWQQQQQTSEPDESQTRSRFASSSGNCTRRLEQFVCSL